MSEADSPDGMTESQRRKRSKGAYETVIHTIEFNSGRVQPPLAKQPSVIGSLHAAGYGSYGLDSLHSTIVACCESGDLFRAKDAKADPRLGINNEQRLVEKIESNLSYDSDPRTDVIGLANQRIAFLRGDRDT
ncbi:hypothetical protein [Natronococcus jeotgali]|uniref:Uncharacterized protein n=1 Tax=Natronococcus jeotgali DSM 18795 TaxID=1227498 RepID=L9Y0G3_9EURY|nr:hypothetical protein [Natronococcus jeotgali]ELY66363.1 hypothetical protein C492_00524 [Natronococcus jeotgali DSM 18795]